MTRNRSTKYHIEHEEWLQTLCGLSLTWHPDLHMEKKQRWTVGEKDRCKSCAKALKAAEKD